MPSMNVKPEVMEFVAEQAKRRDMTKEEMFEVLCRAGVHRMKATINYAKAHRKDPTARKPKKAKGPIARKARKPGTRKTKKSSLLD